MELLEYEDYLRRTQPDWESRWENVQELITFASEVEVGEVDEQETSAEGGLKSVTHFLNPKLAKSFDRKTPLRLFLQASMLSSEGDNQSSDNSKDVSPFVANLSYLTSCSRRLQYRHAMLPKASSGQS